jgi:hypothetical protein
MHAAAAASMNEPAASVGDQEDGITTDDLMTSSSLMEDSRALEIDVGHDHREDEQTQVGRLIGYLFKSLCLFYS